MGAYINGIMVSDREAVRPKSSMQFPDTPVSTSEMTIKELYAYFARVRQGHRGAAADGRLSGNKKNAGSLEKNK